MAAKFVIKNKYKRLGLTFSKDHFKRFYSKYSLVCLSYIPILKATRKNSNTYCFLEICCIKKPGGVPNFNKTKLLSIGFKTPFRSF